MTRAHGSTKEHKLGAAASGRPIRRERDDSREGSLAGRGSAGAVSGLASIPDQIESALLPETSDLSNVPLRTCLIFSKECFPIEWTHSIDKKTLKIQ